MDRAELADETRQTRSGGLQGIAPVARDTLADRAYATLRELLMSGRLIPGERLSLRKVATVLGVSIMPVRAAVSRLIADRALEVTPGRAIRVPLMSGSQFRELAAIRMEIEGFAAEHAARNRTVADLEAIAGFEAAFRAQSLAREPDLVHAVALNMSFHFAVYRASAMPTLVEIIEQLWLRAGPVLNLETRNTPDRLAAGGAYHRHALVLEAMIVGDGATARAMIAQDIDVAATHIIAKRALPES